MAYRVLVVDDSTFFRRRVKEILDQDPNLTVVGEARNGEQAITQVAELKPDVVTMDVEMPVMDGITAVRQIMAKTPVPILMFSSLTHDGAEATLDALDAGALDFLPKKFEDIAGNRKEAIDLLQSRVKALGRRKGAMLSPRPTIARTSPGTTAQTKQFLRPSRSLNEATGASSAPERTFSRPGTSSGKQYKVLAIGTSTGGPVALQTILTAFPANFPYPILLVQHMPGTFTHAFAERLNRGCQIDVKEAQHGDILRPGHAYLAPGGKQMVVDGSAQMPRLSIVDGDNLPNVTYKPSVDLTFTSIARVFGGDVLGVILTGMGADGREGCRALHSKGAKIWAQDEKTCVVYGMPQAVTSARLAEKNLPLSEIASHICSEMRAS
ncbi:chemotaxis response regulator protein-glutamate methylesterase [Aestuariibacter halophilus]|uniref:Protein-glutamate methylesterase/protein-glutamine glutaminase n=1 Tax=Fluctibacter halophilus TaxID=226011 RepID=A0ABS8G3R5_9ALTE|nr:chemotaxis response regulator protein-glutamate methylesterase [Aestuariibacter halophilus]MCC2614771.1 chemotaxis response regulator protein-glutamate methylesterase [Aestuariibacter halophilus]